MKVCQGFIEGDEGESSRVGSNDCFPGSFLCIMQKRGAGRITKVLGDALRDRRISQRLEGKKRSFNKNAHALSQLSEGKTEKREKNVSLLP